MLNRVVGAIERLIDFSGRAVSWLTLLMVLVTFAVVVLRYLFDSGSIALQESVTWLHAMVFMIGAAWALREGAHVRVDIIYNRFSDTGRAWVDLLGSLLLLLPVTGFIGWISWQYVSESWGVMEGSREAGGLPGVFLLKSLIPLMALLLVLQGLVDIARNLSKLRNHE